jgi:hypothetical protein
MSPLKHPVPGISKAQNRTLKRMTGHGVMQKKLDGFIWGIPYSPMINSWQIKQLAAIEVKIIYGIGVIKTTTCSKSAVQVDWSRFQLH